MLATADSYSEQFHFFQVKLDLFDGPIDLLLHLVKQQELPIEKLSLAQVANQYMQCLDAMQRYDLDIAGEYLVIAATLLSIKSSVLLNEPVEFVVDVDGNLIDPHAELLRRLREAEVYKECAAKLGQRDLLGIDVFASPPSLREVSPAPVKYKNHDPMLLGKAFRKLLDQVGSDQEMQITIDRVSIVERMMTILDELKGSGGKRVFYSLVPDLTSRISIVGTLVALLELCKRQIINVEQDQNFEEIMIVLSAEDTEGIVLHSEFDDADESTEFVANA